MSIRERAPALVAPLRAIEVERRPDVDAADMAELLVRIDLKHERPRRTD